VCMFLGVGRVFVSFVNGAATFVGYWNKQILQYFQPEKARTSTTPSRKVQLDTRLLHGVFWQKNAATNLLRTQEVVIRRKGLASMRGSEL